MARVLLLNGPNLNLLGTREPGIYGTETLESIEKRAAELAREAGHELLAFQSNAEAELIGRIQRAPVEGIGFLIFNPGAFTHTSIALRDAIVACGCRSSKCICRIRRRASPFAGTPTSRISRSAASPAWERSVTSWRCALQSANSRALPDSR